MKRIRDWIEESISTKKALLGDDVLVKMKEIIDVCIEALKNGNSIYFCGNGGSAADAQHLAAELSVRYKTNRKALPGLALGTNFSHLTAAANDFGYEEVFSRQLEAIARDGDVLIAISTSGNSPNILKAANTAQDMKVTVVGWTGIGGGQLAGACDYLLDIPSKEVPRIQECHILFGHILCECIDEAFSDAQG
jgi:D-sedoheptulose 7-phosphate isomerase